MRSRAGCLAWFGPFVCISGLSRGHERWFPKMEICFRILISHLAIQVVVGEYT
jgi:hypothetical protein